MKKCGAHRCAAESDAYGLTTSQCDESTCRDVPVRQVHDLDDIFLPTRPPSHPSPTRIRKKTMLRASRLPPKAGVTPRPSKPARSPTASPSTARACSVRRTTQKARTGVRTRSSHGIDAGLNIAAKWLMADWSGKPLARNANMNA